MLIIWWITFVLLLLRFLITALNYWFPQQLNEEPGAVTDLVSILIPVRNEENNIKLLLDSIYEQDFKNYEVIVMDVSSKDDTTQIVQECRKTDSKVRLVQGKELPDGLSGTNQARHQLAQVAKGKYLLFPDTRTQIKPGFIKNAVNLLKRENLALLSVFPDQLMESREEKLLVPLKNYLLLTLLPMFLLRKSALPAFAFADGQCTLYDAAVYKKIKPGPNTESKISDDASGMNRLKELGYNVHSVLGNGFIQCRLYRSYSEGLEDFSENILSFFGRSITILALFLFFTLFSYAVFLWSIPKTNVWLAFIIIVYMRIMISKLSRQNIFDNIVYHPWQMFTLIHISLLAIQKKMS